MKKYILPTLTVMGVALGIFMGMALSQKANAQRLIYQNGQWHLEQTKVDKLLQLMENAYVDSLNIDSITDEAMTELVKKLDPHSAYIPKEDLELVNSELAGSFSGIGVQFTIQQDTVRIVAVIAGGPSAGVNISRRQDHLRGRQFVCGQKDQQRESDAYAPRRERVAGQVRRTPRRYKRDAVLLDHPRRYTGHFRRCQVHHRAQYRFHPRQQVRREHV